MGLRNEATNPNTQGDSIGGFRLGVRDIELQNRRSHLLGDLDGLAV
jgi:hypothetical protein